MKSKKLWTKDFSCITLATVLSAIGGEAMTLPVSLLVFDETQSAFLSSLVMICGILPDVLLPIFIAPFIDKAGKKKWILGMDLMLAAVYASMGFWVGRHTFHFLLYLLFTLTVGTISVIYRLAYASWYPDLIPRGMEQKGYAVSSTLYPTVIIVMSPIAAFLYENLTIDRIFFLVTGITLCSVMTEILIRETKKAAASSYTLRQYCTDIREGFSFLKKEKGIRNIYANMSVMQGTANGLSIITQVYFQTQPYLGATMLGFLISSEMAGRLLGGLLQYKKEVPVNKRYPFTKAVYLIYSLADMALLFLPYPAMLANRFFCGSLGICSATIRESAVQSYLPEQMRARVNAFFNVLFAVGGVAFQFLAGALGQLIPYRAVAVLLGGMAVGSVFLFIVLPAANNRPVYEAERS
ncbi:MAG: MFS transporter [Lachnospiraceae bacterium]|nr:MFS transporter [Lachnospiraceae bacterium]